MTGQIDKAIGSGGPDADRLDDIFEALGIAQDMLSRMGEQLKEGRLTAAEISALLSNAVTPLDPMVAPDPEVAALVARMQQARSEQEKKLDGDAAVRKLLALAGSLASNAVSLLPTVGPLLWRA